MKGKGKILDGEIGVKFDSNKPVSIPKTVIGGRCE
jgi:hypothetical protein